MALALQIITLTCLCVIVIALLVAGFFLRKTARLNEITRKLRAREPLTGREQHLLNRIMK